MIKLKPRTNLLEIGIENNWANFFLFYYIFPLSLLSVLNLVWKERPSLLKLILLDFIKFFLRLFFS